MPDESELKAALEREAELFADYLISRRPPRQLLDRYIAAHTVHFTAPPVAKDTALLSFAVRHPWALPYLDTVLSLFRPHSFLRSKVLLMLAILEACPHYTEFFLAEPTLKSRVTADVLGYGVIACVKLIVGVLLYPMAARTARNR